MASPTGAPLAEVAAGSVPRMRRAAAAWAARPLRSRLAILRAVRRTIAERVDGLADVVRAPWRGSRAETISAEVLPLAEACRFLEREAARVLAERRLGRRGRPVWLRGNDARVRREPWGIVLIVGPANYPLMLPGIQALQALAAGNAVLLKPGRGGGPAARAFAEILEDAGLPAGLLSVLDESPAAVRDALRAGVDKVLLTGSVQTGREVMGQLAPLLVPATMELSGCDAVFVREDADLDLVARALRFGMTFNGSFTCVAPRRVFVARSRADELERRLARSLGEVAPMKIDPETAERIAALTRNVRWSVGGAPTEHTMHPSVAADVAADSALLRADLAAPLIALVPVDSDEQALELDARCPYALGATVFGSPAASERLAERVDAGIVVVNDMIVPTADPRVPFGGRGDSGFGVTRGAEGLLEMTRPKTVILSRSRFRPHLDPIGPLAERMLPAFVRLSHAAGVGTRMKALNEIIRTVIQERKKGDR